MCAYKMGFQQAQNLVKDWQFVIVDWSDTVNQIETLPIEMIVYLGSEEKNEIVW